MIFILQFSFTSQEGTLHHDTTAEKTDYTNRYETYHFWMHELLQIGLTESSIPAISNMSSIHDLSKEITQVLPRHLCGLHNVRKVSLNN